jgi:small subunit ribosomal protein S6
LGKNPKGGGILMNKYEIMYIINPALIDDARTEAMAKVEGILTAGGAINVKAEKWGERKLAYPIEKKQSGYYILTTFEIDGTKLADIEKKLNITESVMRYIIVK